MVHNVVLVVLLFALTAQLHAYSVFYRPEGTVRR